jgi:hypothetical protein
MGAASRVRASSSGASSRGASRRTTTAPTRLAGPDVRHRRLGVTGGVYGRHPDIFTLDDDENTIYSQAAGTHRSTDFRDVYGTILKHFVNMTPANILANVLPLDGGAPAELLDRRELDLGLL